jgi:26S proteasome regulatory subunit N2
MMAPYLPRDNGGNSPYPEGGALFALGLIYVNHGHDVQPFLLQVRFIYCILKYSFINIVEY